MKTFYKDWYGTYSIELHRNLTATLKCRNDSNGHLDLNKTYKSELGAKRALSRYCDGMPEVQSKEQL